MTKAIQRAIREYFPIPPHIEECAAIVRAEILYGPLRVAIPVAGIEHVTLDDCESWPYEFDDLPPGATVEEVWPGRVGDALRDYIESLPSVVYVHVHSEEVSEREPEDEICYECDGKDADCPLCVGAGTIPVFWEDWYMVERGDIIESLFGRTIAREFR